MVDEVERTLASWAERWEEVMEAAALEEEKWGVGRMEEARVEEVTAEAATAMAAATAERVAAQAVVAWAMQLCCW